MAKDGQFPFPFFQRLHNIMLHKLRGIVLKTTTYSESSVVVQIFSDQFGLQSYLVNGVRKPKAKIPLNLLQPLHLLEMVASHKITGSMHRIAEARAAPIFSSIPYDITKSSMVMFLNEVLYQAIKHQGTDERLFDFIFNAICWLDEAPAATPNFHLSFLIKTTRFLGFAPTLTNLSDQIYFDLQEGTFTSLPPAHPNYIGHLEASLLIQLFSLPFEQLHTLQISSPNRRILLTKILRYYGLHISGFGEIKSHEVLEEILR